MSDGSQAGPDASAPDLLAVYTWRTAQEELPVSLSGRLRRLAWMVSVVRALPWARIRLSDSAQGAAIARLLKNRSVRVPLTTWRARFGYCVLELPSTFDEYLSGHQRRRLRKRLNRVSQGVLTIRPLTDDQRCEVERSLLTDVEPKRIETRRAAQVWLGAFGESSEPVAVAIALLDGSAALLHTSQGNLRGRDIDVRYALHTKLVERLIDSGVELLLTDSQNCFRSSLALLQYQYQLGYVVRNLMWRRTSAADPAGNSS